MRQCCRQADGRASISPLTRLVPERSTPELQHLETRWASLVSYGLTVRALQDFLPVDEELNGSLERDDVERLYATDPFLVHGIFVLERVAPWLVFVDRWCASA